MQSKIHLLFLLLLSFASCKNEKKSENRLKPSTEVKISATPNQLSEAEKEAGWTLLFNGKTTEGWHLYNYPDSTSVWQVVDGTLYCDSKNREYQQGDFVTDREFENYELVFDWKLAKESNSGVFINVQESPKYAAAWHTGPEYQLLDPEHRDQVVANKRSGCLFAFYPQLNPTETNRAGEWNTSKIKQVDGKVEFYLNGNLTAKADFTSPQWTERIAETHFTKFPNYGKATKGRIGLQDWFSDAWFRNIKIREL
ncbi:DUF1080 domain-containing protein [Flavobacteriaceae bacterium F89]|uniref:DUF1080 domain-containing protein n=1 Tax=Cerina litoralis TaxID=2874477 RepID=A0AAE3ETX6_9FLAO|nr:DUF1080 domain-containing protein [Cerina litoralis]MCG2461045.1 DUF1080 domain-containing protein [Cerina litoralis]